MVRVIFVAAAVLVATPAHAFLTGQPGGFGQGAYTNQNPSGVRGSGNNNIDLYRGGQAHNGDRGRGRHQQEEKAREHNSGGCGGRGCS